MPFLASQLSTLNPEELTWQIERHEVLVGHQFERNKHSHFELELLYITSGKCEMFAGGSFYKLKEGELMFIDSQVPHAMRVDSKETCRILLLEVSVRKAGSSEKFRISDFLKQKENRLFWQADKKVAVFEDTDLLLYHQINNLFRLLNQQREELEIFLQMSLLFYEVCRQYWQTSKASTGNLSADIQSALRFIEEHYEQEIRIEDVAHAASLSRSRLQHKFRMQTGLTVTEQVHRLRVKKAQYLLETTNLSVLDIAFRVGFNSRQHFTDVFKKISGMIPNMYRKARKNSLLKG